MSNTSIKNLSDLNLVECERITDWPVMASYEPVVMFPGPSFMFGFRLGTGGAGTVEYILNRGAKGYPYPFVNYADMEHPDIDFPGNTSSIQAFTPSNNLARIRDILQPTVTDLAKAFDVSRQAVYAWQAGGSIAPENALRLENLARATDILVGSGLKITPLLLRRTIWAGKNLFDIVREDGPVIKAVNALITMIRQEISQRETLQAKLAKHPPVSFDIVEEMGVPMLCEEG